MHPDFQIEAHVCTPVAGIDEAGRGPWAGPVIAAAVILDRSALPEGIDDSKRLSPKRRAVLFDQIRQSAQIGIGQASVEEIDRFNILRANDLAMIRALADLGGMPATILIDGNRIPPAITAPARAITKGDQRSLSIAAASIIAKVTRDRLMARLARDYPCYGWETNAGYGTAAHRRALDEFGISPHHRRSFRPISRMLSQAKR